MFLAWSKGHFCRARRILLASEAICSREFLVPTARLRARCSKCCLLLLEGTAKVIGPIVCIHVA